jgi:hypothetical protein
MHNSKCTSKLQTRLSSVGAHLYIKTTNVRIKNLVTALRWVTDTKRDWPNSRRLMMTSVPCGSRSSASTVGGAKGKALRRELIVIRGWCEVVASLQGCEERPTLEAVTKQCSEGRDWELLCTWHWFVWPIHEMFEHPIYEITTQTLSVHHVSIWRIASSGMWRRVVLVRTVVSEELLAYIIWLKRMSELGITSAITSN